MIYLDLIMNLSLLVAISVVSGFINQRWAKHPVKGPALQGILFGSVAVIVMFKPFVLSQGLIFDGRSVVLSLCSLFYGPVASIISGTMAIFCRLSLGGQGALTGTLVILSSCLIGLTFYYRRQSQGLPPPSTKTLYAFGLIVHGAMLLMMFTLPLENALKTLANIGLPVMLLYPLATILVGKILSDQETASILNERLFQAQKMESIGRLAGGVAHDFNNMLAVILGNAELAMEKQSLANLPSELSINGELKEILRAGKKSADLTRQLLAFARKQDIVPQTLDLNQTIGSMLKMLHRLIGENIKLNWQPDEKLWPVKMDPTQIDQILANLTVNARDAITGNGTITIKTTNVEISQNRNSAKTEYPPGEYVVIEFIDNGCGIDNSLKPHIFEPFFTTKQLGKGTGLGLATVYGIVKQNNGFIDLQSQPGAGTTFKIYLLRDKEPTRCIAEANSETFNTGGLETVLIVEDELALLNVCQIIVQRLGYNVLVASSPEEALKIATSFPGTINLLITDVILPGLDGTQLARQIRQIHPEIREIFVSGYCPNTISPENFPAEASFLQKPFSSSDLAQKIRQTIGTTAPLQKEEARSTNK